MDGYGIFSYIKMEIVMRSVKNIIFIFIVVLCFFTFCTTSGAEEADTNINLDSQTIKSKEYRNNGITGIYDIDIFVSDDSIFKQKKLKENNYYKNVGNSLFVESNINLENIKVENQVRDMKLFSEVKHYFKTDEKENSKEYSFYIFAVLLICLAAVMGFFGARFFKSKKKRKKE